MDRLTVVELEVDGVAIDEVVDDVDGVVVLEDDEVLAVDVSPVEEDDSLSAEVKLVLTDTLTAVELDLVDVVPRMRDGDEAVKVMLGEVVSMCDREEEGETEEEGWVLVRVDSSTRVDPALLL